MFSDRLVDEKDQEWLYDKIFKAGRDKVKDDLYIAIKSVLDEKKIRVLSNKDAIKFICFADVMEDGISIFDRSYDEVTGKNGLSKRMNAYLEDYNQLSKKPMSLVLFDFAV